MYQQDYILRLIESVGVMLRRLLSELREARPEEAVRTSSEALAEATGLNPALAESLTAEGLLSLLAAGGFDAKRALLVGEVLVRRAEALEAAGDVDRASAERRRALVVLTEVGRRGTAEDATAAALLVDEMAE